LIAVQPFKEQLKRRAKHPERLARPCEEGCMSSASTSVASVRETASSDSWLAKHPNAKRGDHVTGAGRWLKGRGEALVRTEQTPAQILVRRRRVTHGYIAVLERNWAVQ
jgi:hypothetical protein